MTNDPWAKKKSLYAVPSAAQPKNAKKKRNWSVLGFFWRSIKRFCMVIGAGVLIMSAISLWTFSALITEFEPKQLVLPNQMVLYIELDGAMSDLPRQVSLLDPFAPQGTTVLSFINALDRAKVDPRVKGIYARLKGGGYSLAHLQEMRHAIKRFRMSGKFAYIYSSSYAETGGLGSYYLASAFDEIWMQPMGNVSVAGINAEMPFLRGALDKIGVEPQFFQRKEYKTAYESLISEKMSGPSREMMNVLIGDLAKTILKDIAQDRKTTPQTFRALVDRGLFTAPEAKKVGLVDILDYADVLVEKINEQVTGDKASPDLPYTYLSDYIASTHGKPFAKTQNAVADFIGPKQPEVYGPQRPDAKRPAPVIATAESVSGKPKIALIYAIGAIVDSKETSAKAPSVMVDDGIAAADEIAGALLDAADDASLDAVVLRIDSPGGSPVASETILRAVERVKARGKKVIVSMGPTAASGGYWIAAYADRIFVLPTTITGSIGVLGGKISARQLWANLGVTWDGVKWGENSGLWSINTPFNPQEAERINAMLDNVYVNFIARVAKGRKMKEADVETIARGRVWTGVQAIDVGLADQIGGLDVALDYTAMIYGANNRHDAQIVTLPKPLTPIEEFVKLLEGQVMAGQVVAGFSSAVSGLQPFLTQAAVMNRPVRHPFVSFNPI